MANNASESYDELVSSGKRPGENLVAWTVWGTYGAFYFCRQNLSAAVPGMKASVADGGLGLTPEQVGLILGSLKIAYGCGQFLNGQLSELISPRIMLAIGMFGSALLNVLFGFGTSFYFLLFVWAANGYCQSLGWTPCVRVLANWIPVERRGKVIGFVGTGYQLTGALAVVVAGFGASRFGWQGAVYLPAGILFAAGLTMLFLLEETPSDLDADNNQVRNLQPRKSFGETFSLTFSNRSLWLLGLSLALLNACRYGYTDWGVTHLVDIQRAKGFRSPDILMNAMKLAILPLGGIVGALVAGWATDRFFSSRRAPVACVLTFVLAILSFFYDGVAHASLPGTLIILFFIGFCIFGPQVLLVGTAPADLARKGTAAAAAGFVNFMGYLGAAGADWLTGKIQQETGWGTTIYMWAGWALGAAITSGLLWNARSKSDD